MQAIKAVIFDLGGVLIDWNPEYLYRKIFTDPEEMRFFLSEICTPDWNEQQDEGRTLNEGTELLVESFPQYESEIRAYYGRWQEMLKGPIAPTVNLLRQLKEEKKVELYALTNWSAETYPIAYQRYAFLHWFKGVLVSGQEKIRKPFPAIFQLMCERYSLKPEESLFIDDNARNVAAAAELGFHTLHFKGPEKLQKDFIATGLLTQ